MSGVIQKTKGAVTAASGAASSAASSAASTAASAAMKVKDAIMQGPFPFWGLLVVVVVTFVCFVIWLKYRKNYETPNNVRDMAAAQFLSAKEIINTQGNRYGLVKYLRPCENTSGAEATTCKSDDLFINPQDTQIVLSNFYFNTVRVPGCFFGDEPVFSPDAIRFACKGGARAFVFDIWPSLDGRGGFRPILQLVEEGSNWRRISMNFMEFETAVEAIVSEVYGGSVYDADRKTDRDITLFYLRFQGIPRPQTYASVAATLAKHTQPYMLDPSFAYARGEDRLVKTSIRELQGKMLFFVNKTKAELNSHQGFFSFMNMCAPAPESDVSAALMKLEYTPQDLKNLSTADKTRIVGYIRSRITFLILPTYDPAVKTNEWDWKAALDVGIHCIPMNIFERENDRSKAYYKIFSRYSYKWKPEFADFSEGGFQNKVSLRLPLVVVPPPLIPADPGTGDGTLSANANLQTGERCRDILQTAQNDTDAIHKRFQAYIQTINSEMTSLNLQNQTAEVRKNYLGNVVDFLLKLMKELETVSNTLGTSFRNSGCKPADYRSEINDLVKKVNDVMNSHTSFSDMKKNVK